MSNLSKRILVVDDEPGMCRLLDTVLTGEGHEVTASQKPVLVLSILKQESFDLVITDIRMPKVNGLEILEAIKSSSPKVPVILITAFSTVESAIQAMKLGASDYVVKPFRNDQIKLAVYRVFERERLLDENKRLKTELASHPSPPSVPTLANFGRRSYREAKQQVLNEFEKTYLTQLLAKSGGNISQAAAWADMDRKNFYDLLKRHNLYAPADPLPKN